MNNLSKKLVIMALVIALSVGVTLPNFASEVNAQELEQGEPELSQKVIDKADPYIKVKNERFVIVEAGKLKEEIGNEDFAKVKEFIQEANATLKNFEEEVE